MYKGVFFKFYTLIPILELFLGNDEPSSNIKHKNVSQTKKNFENLKMVFITGIQGQFLKYNMKCKLIK